jgi:hypothetical protein
MSKQQMIQGVDLGASLAASPSTTEACRMSGAVSKIITSACLLGVLSVAGSAQSLLSAARGGGARFEPASVLVPAGNTCALYPEGKPDQNQTISVSADEDGVVRFMAVRPTLPDSLARLTLDCTDSNGNKETYSVDLRLEDAFQPRPFDPSLTNLTFRPALARDPLSYTRQELIQGGYGFRPDPNQNPAGYQMWLATASTPAYKARSRRTSLPSARLSQPLSEHPMPQLSGHDPDLNISSSVHINPSNYWTGAILSGSYQKGATASKTYSYLENQATFNVPWVYPGAYNSGVTTMTIWTGLDNVFQAIVDVQATATTVVFGIHHQDIASPQKWIHCPTSSGPCTNPKNDAAGVTFTPNAGDEIWAQEWYCDAKGNENLWGGYACTNMMDITQGIIWDCSQASGSDCQSYALPADLVNGNLGRQAEYIIEDDTPHAGEFPDFSPVTMSGIAWVVQGSGSSGAGTFVTTSTDPYVALRTDATSATPRGNGHLIITLPTDAVKWTDVVTNIYYWNGTNFNSFAPGCATSIGVGPNSHGLTNGTPWITDCPDAYGGQDFSDGNQNVWQMQKDGFWVKKQDDVATQVAVSPEGVAWAIDASGNILYWDGSKFVDNGFGGCARAIGVGPKSGYQTNGTPWIIGCHAGADGNYDVYQLQTGGTSDFHLTSWVKVQDDVATQIAVSPEGIPWAINASGQILHWNGSKFVVNSDAGCATSIGVGPNSSGLTNGTPWITRCTVAADGNYNVAQLQTGGDWVKMQDGVGIGFGTLHSGSIAVAPDTGIAWVLSTPLLPPAAQVGSRWQ